MEPDEIVCALYGDHLIPDALVPEIKRNGFSLRKSICEDFRMLRDIVERHESLIKRRWSRKTRAQREQVLSEAWPGIPQVHRPDFALWDDNPDILEENGPSMKEIFVWPYINAEDLFKARLLLHFIEARARDSPWTFALCETAFCYLASLPHCVHHEEDVDKVAIRFSKEADPYTYCEPIDLNGVPPNQDPNATFHDLCPRKGLVILMIQERIYSFLVGCLRQILHDCLDKALDLYSDKSLAPQESSKENEIGSASFADSILLAPYRAHNRIDFTRLRAYLAALMNNAGDHIWSLREDPEYFVERLKEIGNHSLALIKEPKGRSHPFVNMNRHVKYIARSTVIDAYTSLGH